MVLSNVCIKTGVYAWFIANRSVIETELCVQKEIANNCCKGSCVLEKKMEETGDQTSNATLPALKKLPDLSVYTLMDAFELEFIPIDSRITANAIFQTETKGISLPFFHPPAC